MTDQSQLTPNIIPEYKVVLLGPQKCGKSKWIKRFMTGEFDSKYIETIGVEIVPIVLTTNYGKYRLNCFDISGDSKFDGLSDGFCIASDAVMFFRKSPDKPSRFEKLSLISNCPKVYVTSKFDLKKNQSIKDIDNGSIKKPFYQISAKSNYNFEKPFISLLRQLTGHEDLTEVYQVC
jgi:GTP-binding nuclear protein Ran